MLGLFYSYDKIIEVEIELLSLYK